jgi:hypothetical protein
MRRILAPVWLGCLSSLLLTQIALAGSGGNTANEGAHGLDPTALVGIAVLLMIARLAGEFYKRIKQPAVLGELIGGIISAPLSVMLIRAISDIFMRNAKRRWVPARRCECAERVAEMESQHRAL